MTNNSRIPSLDGLRALSISFVLVGHAAGTRNFEVADNVRRWLSLGNLGVRVFFVISGFLITSLLVAEFKKTQTISLTQFYFRRTFRIFPAFYFFVSIMLVATAIGWIDLSASDVVHAVTYTTNYNPPPRAWELGHLWSLAVEEQFYLLWPALLLFVGLHRGVLMAVVCIIAAPVLRVATYLFADPSSKMLIDESFQTVMDAIAFGCLLALLRPRLDASARYLSLLASRWFVLVPIAVLALHQSHFYPSISYPIGFTLLNLGIALCVDRAIRHPSGWSGRVLNWSPLVWLGALSYSLYLWQQPFLNRNDPHDWTSFPINIGAAFACAIVSYYLVEKPCLRARAAVGHALFGKANE